MKRLVASCLALGLAVTGMSPVHAERPRPDRGEARRDGPRFPQVEPRRDAPRMERPRAERPRTERAEPRREKPRSDQGEARREMHAGKILRSREIEARVLPMMGDAEYLGFEYDSVAMAYRLKFIRSGRVLFVDVDARTGSVLRRNR